MQVSEHAGRPTRRLWVLGALILASLTLATAAAADDGADRVGGNDDGWDIDGDHIVNPGGGLPGDGPPSGGDGQTPTETSDGPAPEGTYVGIYGANGEDGEMCWYVTWRTIEGLDPAHSLTYAEMHAEMAEAYEDRDADQCPAEEVGEVDDPDPTGAVHVAWSEAAFLPDNDLQIDPDGQALTGMPAYLEIQGDRTLGHEAELPAPFSTTVTFEASATYDVAWGDGASSGPFTSTGGPYPDGDITHTYTDTGDVEVVVTAQWTGTWSVGEFSGELPLIERAHSLPLEIDELQAVRTSDR